MNTDEILKNIEIYKKQFGMENSQINFEEFNKFFFVDNFFLSKNTPYLKEKFYETTAQIIGNIIRSTLQDLEYYVNLKPVTTQTSLEFQTIQNEKKLTQNLLKLYFNIHKIHKEFICIYLNKKEGTIKIIEFLNDNISMLKNYNKILKEILEKIIIATDKKINQIDKENQVNSKNPVFD
jgi:transcriptional regulator with PAS, ATPase and Fis domain